MKNLAVKVVLFICVANVASLLALMTITHYTKLLTLTHAADYSFVLMVWFWVLTTLFYLVQPGTSSTFQIAGDRTVQRIDDLRQVAHLQLNVCLKLFLSSLPAALFCLLSIEI